MVDEAEKMLFVAQRARKTFAEKTPDLFEVHYPSRTVEKHDINTFAGNTQVFVYRPHPAAESLPVFVNMHGGGFVQGSAADDGVWCQRIADGAGCCVINIEYHLSPEHKFPVALEECYDVVKWVHDQAEKLGVDTRRIAIGGHSAGGNLAAVICLLARERRDFSLACQILNHPPLDLSLVPFRHESLDIFLTPQVQKFFTACYIRTAEDALNPMVSPLRATDLSELPPALMISAEHDSLREEQERYVRRMKTAGVDVTYRCFTGCMHAFTHRGMEPAASEAWEMIQEQLRQFFSLKTENQFND